MGRLVEMVVESVRVHMLSNRHVVILKDAERERYLPIWIGPWEASAIAMRLQGISAERPLTHDLFAAALEQLGVRIDRVVISELADETYHARLFLERNGEAFELDARPSDSVALAVRADVRILVAEEVLAQAALGADPGEEEAGATEAPSSRAGRPGMGPSVPLESLGEAVVDERLDMFREFVNSLDVDPGSAGGSGGSTGPGAPGSGGRGR
ncbi:MAG TPA: bifunctional nuclease family protein [Candidatus Sulfomarinibacteraceae bacterium]|nr:bifunctional nuclease family protein [Candidatus Sulfomarinibacteraceae bacterium]